MHAVLFLSHLLAIIIAIKQIHIRVILVLYTWSANTFHQANQINRALVLIPGS